MTGFPESSRPGGTGGPTGCRCLAVAVRCAAVSGGRGGGGGGGTQAPDAEGALPAHTRSRTARVPRVFAFASPSATDHTGAEAVALAPVVVHANDQRGPAILSRDSVVWSGHPRPLRPPTPVDVAVGEGCPRSGGAPGTGGVDGLAGGGGGVLLRGAAVVREGRGHPGFMAKTHLVHVTGDGAGVGETASPFDAQQPTVFCDLAPGRGGGGAVMWATRFSGELRVQSASGGIR